MSRLGFELGQEDRFEHEVAELFGERDVIVAVDRVEHFVGFLEDERLQRVDRLLAVPGTPAWSAQGCHDVDETAERRRRAGRVGHLLILNKWRRRACRLPRSCCRWPAP